MIYKHTLAQIMLILTYVFLLISLSKSYQVRKIIQYGRLSSTSTILKLSKVEDLSGLTTDISLDPSLSLVNITSLSSFNVGSTSTITKLNIPNFETDFMGMINFCLRNSDKALSGPSRSKVLNEITNDVYKAIMIGFEPLIDDTILKIPKYKLLAARTECVLDSSQVELKNCNIDLDMSQKYIDWLSDLLVDGTLHLDKVIGGNAYDVGFKKLLTLLKDSGCTFKSPSSTREDITSSTTATNVNVRPKPKDRNICLSILDTYALTSLSSPPVTSVSINNKNNDNIALTKTMELNEIANVVARTMIHGSTKERSFIASHLPNVTQQFADRWMLNMDDSCASQEVNFINVLGIFLDKNLNAAEMASTFNGVFENNNENTLSSIAGTTTSSTMAPTSNSFASDVVTGATTIFNTEILGSLLVTPTTASGNNIPSPTTSTTAAVVGDTSSTSTLLQSSSSAISTASSLADGMNLEIKQPLYRLYDTYKNAFNRVVEMCLTETSTRSTVADITTAQRDELLINFLGWEQGLRRNLTQDLWKTNPSELEGIWELIDVAGDGSLKSIMTAPSAIFQDRVDGTEIEFSSDGKLNLLKSTTNIGMNWYFKPGPAHLDTCEFFIRSTSKSDLILKYVGFIDRGQRIESRFSKNPIRMTGRILSILNGEYKGSSRFIMVLKTKKKISTNKLF